MGEPAISESGDTIHFIERQRFRQPLIVAVIAFAAGVQWLLFVRQIVLGRPVGDEAVPDWLVVVLWAVIGVGLPAALWRLSMVTEVTSAGVSVDFRPVTRQWFAAEEIAAVEPLAYRPLREFGGWGVRWGSQNRRAFTVSGDRGVELTLRDGRRVVLGSSRPDELAADVAAIVEGRSP